AADGIVGGAPGNAHTVERVAAGECARNVGADVVSLNDIARGAGVDVNTAVAAVVAGDDIAGTSDRAADKAIGRCVKVNAVAAITQVHRAGDVQTNDIALNGDIAGITAEVDACVQIAGD